MIYARFQKTKMEIFVMRHGMAGIQIRRDASGDIHFVLDSSTPCWNDAIEEFTMTDRGPSGPRIFKGDTKSTKKDFSTKVRQPPRLSFPLCQSRNEMGFLDFLATL